MNAEVRRLWVEDLRANPDKQGKGYLTRMDTVNGVSVERDCCLGRLCKLAIAAGVKVPTVITVKDPAFQDYKVIKYGVDLNYTSLPREVMDWAGLDSDNPLLPSLSLLMPRSCSVVNDEGNTFPEIAAAIEGDL